MRWFILTLIGLFPMMMRGGLADEAQYDSEASIINCIFKYNSLICAGKKIASEIDRIEAKITGRNSQMPISKIIEEGGSLMADAVHAIFGLEDDRPLTEANKRQNDEIEESRKKKFGKKKKKHLQKLLLIAMLLKSKISLLLQLLSTHFQVKFFLIAILSLLMNAARFWLDLKKSHRPSKVIYYEHAQHQHHYDHDDDHGIWGRSSDEAPQELAYSAYVPEH